MLMIQDKNYSKLKQTFALSRLSIESFNFMGALQSEPLETASDMNRETEQNRK